MVQSRECLVGIEGRIEGASLSDLARTGRHHRGGAICALDAGRGRMGKISLYRRPRIRAQIELGGQPSSHVEHGISKPRRRSMGDDGRCGGTSDIWRGCGILSLRWVKGEEVLLTTIFRAYRCRLGRNNLRLFGPGSPVLFGENWVRALFHQAFRLWSVLIMFRHVPSLRRLVP